MSSHPNIAIEYRTLDLRQIDLIRPLWEKLNAHHAGISSHFSDELRVRRFEDRKLQLLVDGKRVQTILATVPYVQDVIGYCIASVTSQGEGEIDSVYIDESYRGQQIGTELMHRALAWLDEHGAESKSVIALYENDPAIRFYARFGFYPRTVNLIQKKEFS